MPAETTAPPQDPSESLSHDDSGEFRDFSLEEFEELSTDEQFDHLIGVIDQIGPVQRLDSQTHDQSERFVDFHTKASAFTERSLRGAFQYDDPRTIKVDAAATADFFDNLTSLRTYAERVIGVNEKDERFADMGAGGYVSQAFNTFINRAVQKNVSRLFKYGNQGRGDRGHVYPGLVESTVLHAMYLGNIKDAYPSASLIAAAKNEGYMDMIMGDEFAEIDTPVWNEALTHRLVESAAIPALAEGKKLSPETVRFIEKRIMYLGGFDQEQAGDIFLQWRGSQGNPETRTQLQRANEFARHISNQVRSLVELRQLEEGAPRQLYETFGIRHYGRYNTEQLAQQLDPDFAPTDVVISATDDWNGAFKNLQEKTKDVVSENPLFVEASNTTELARIFYRLKQRDQNKVPRIVVAAHGSTDSMSLGRERHNKNAEILQDSVESAASLQKLTEKGLIQFGTEIVLFSCNTGHDNAIGESISRLPGIKRVIAPDLAPSGITTDDRGEFLYTKKDPGEEEEAHLARVHSRPYYDPK